MCTFSFSRHLYRKRVMAALGAATHAFPVPPQQGVDGRAKPGRDRARAVSAPIRKKRFSSLRAKRSNPNPKQVTDS
jgi:hypothetical protein